MNPQLPLLIFMPLWPPKAMVLSFPDTKWGFSKYFIHYFQNYYDGSEMLMLHII